MKKLLALAALAAIILVIPSDTAEATRRRVQGRASPSVSSTLPLPLVLRDATLYDDLQLWAHTNYSAHMWEEAFDAVALTHADTAADSVGQIDDPSPSAHLVQWMTASRRGVLRTEAVTSRSYVELRSAGSNDFANVQDSTRSFMNCHGTAVGGSRSCTIILWVGVIADGGAITLVDNHQATSANVGFSILKTAANRIQFFNSAGGSTSCNLTTSASADLVVADGIVPVGIRISGTTVQVNVGVAAEEGFTCAAAGSAAAATNELTIGGNAATTGTTDMNFGGMMVFDRSLTDVEYAAVIADVGTGVRSTQSLLMEVDAADGYYNFASQIFDFTEPLTMASDAGHTVPVTAVGRGIASVRDPRDLSNYLGRAATSTATDYIPRWVGDSGAEWVGTAPQSLVWAPWKSRGGATTVIAEVEQDKLTFGSHWCEGNGYGTMTGADYIDNPGGVPYWVVHTTSGGGATAPLINDGVGFSIIEAVRNGSSWVGTTSGQGSNTVTNANAGGCTSIGRENVIGTRMDGRIRRLYQYNANLSAAQIARVRTSIEADSEYTNGEDGFVFPRAFVAGLGAPWANVLGQESTAAGTSSPFTLTPTISGGFVETGIDFLYNTEAGCGACTLPTRSTVLPDYLQLVSGTSVLETAGIFTMNFGTASPRDLSVAAGFTIAAPVRYETNVLGDRGALMIFATNYDTVNFEPRQAIDVVGYAHDSGDAVVDGWWFCTDTNTCTALGASAPRDGRDYYASCHVQDGGTTGACILLDMSNPEVPVVAHRSDSFALPATGGATYGIEINASPGPLLGAPQVAHAFRIYSVRGALAYNP